MNPLRKLAGQTAIYGIPSILGRFLNYLLVPLYTYGLLTQQEYGIVNLKGRSTNERARLLIGIAHPDFREELERDAYNHRLIPHGFF